MCIEKIKNGMHSASKSCVTVLKHFKIIVFAVLAAIVSFFASMILVGYKIGSLDINIFSTGGIEEFLKMIAEEPITSKIMYMLALAVVRTPVIVVFYAGIIFFTLNKLAQKKLSCKDMFSKSFEKFGCLSFVMLAFLLAIIKVKPLFMILQASRMHFVLGMIFCGLIGAILSFAMAEDVIEKKSFVDSLSLSLRVIKSHFIQILSGALLLTLFLFLGIFASTYLANLIVDLKMMIMSFLNECCNLEVIAYCDEGCEAAKQLIACGFATIWFCIIETAWIVFATSVCFMHKKSQNWVASIFNSFK